LNISSPLDFAAVQVLHQQNAECECRMHSAADRGSDAIEPR
jgi:hypothetical protein